MKILLIQPPTEDFYQTSIRTQPIGLAYLAASLITQGYEVEILDCQTEKKRSISIPAEFSYLKDVYPFNDRSPFKLYGGYYHFGMGWEEIGQRIEDSEADVFGISSNFTPYHGEAIKIAEMIKEWNEKKIVLMGGSHISCDPEGVLNSSLVDYVILGEGEKRLPLLLDQIAGGNAGKIEEIDGLGYRKDGAIRINPIKTFIENLDAIPSPARELLNLDRYRTKKKRSTMIITSRGCPHGCAYCSAHRVMGATFRTRSPEAILQEMMECRNEYGIEIFDIEDDNFTFDQERAKTLLGLIIKTFGEQALELTAMNGVSFASLDSELLRLMKRAGFHTLNLSFVSVDSSTKKRMGRPVAKRDFGQILEEAGRVDFNIVAYAILGMPGQTIREMVETLIYLMGKRVLIGPSIYYPTPGTDLFKECKEMDILPSDPAQWRSSTLPIETKEFSRLDIATLFRLARMINFIKGKMDVGEFSEGMTWKGLIHTIRDEAKVKDEVRFNSPLNRSDRMTWMGLLLMLFEKKMFFGLRRNSEGGMSFFEEGTSKMVLNHFFEKAWEKPILKSRHD
jgi:anaerobic magnesium-protoporphyrin IX monomethyl ester cyclase